MKLQMWVLWEMAAPSQMWVLWEMAESVRQGANPCCLVHLRSRSMSPLFCGPNRCYYSLTVDEHGTGPLASGCWSSEGLGRRLIRYSVFGVCRRLKRSDGQKIPDVACIILLHIGLIPRVRAWFCVWPRT